jgi:hypothetical protein
MRRYRGPRGEQRLWFGDDEIESLVEDRLREAGLTPTPGRPVVDLERFIEQHLCTELDQYAVLDPDVLGLTEFTPGKAPRISINRDLTAVAVDCESASLGSVGRWRATVAHEGAHVLLHSVLFDLDANQVPLFSDANNGPSAQGLMRCLKRDVGLAVRSADWREVQANRGMASLLMPRSLFVSLAQEAMAALGLSTPSAGSPDASVLARELATRFTVSHQAAKIRLETLRLVSPAGAAALPPE